ncbi:MAG: hypothetical protein COV79_05135, partial [Parcubacteria group bacterium CG11_big_fil_rev_8_21_14_0_20_41_14]
SLAWMIRKATLPKGATRPRDDPKSDPAAGSDKAASESGMFADGSGRFAPSGLVAGLVDPKSDPAEGSDKAAGSSENDKARLFFGSICCFVV